MKTTDTARAIAKGGGVAMKVLVRGPRQARWMKLLERVSKKEVTGAVLALVRHAGGNANNAAAYLGVPPAFLKRYGLPERAFDKPATAGSLAPYRTPTNPDFIAQIIGALGGVGAGRGGGGSGAWRIVDLLEGASSKKAALEAVSRAIESCQSIGEVAAVFGVTRMLLWKWRQRFPEIDALVREKEDHRPRQKVSLKIDGRRRLSIDEAVELMRPYLPATATVIAEGIDGAPNRPHGVVLTPREISFYIGKPTSTGLMVVRWPSRQNGKVVKTLTLVDTNDGKRLDPRPSRGAHHCSLCGGVGHNRVKCPDQKKGNSDATKTPLGASTNHVRRVRRRSGEASRSAPKARRSPPSRT